MNIDDIIRSYLMLHPDTPIDMTEYPFPLRGVKHLIEAAMTVERMACADVAENWRCNGMPRTTLAEQIRARGQE